MPIEPLVGFGNYLDLSVLLFLFGDLLPSLSSGSSGSAARSANLGSCLDGWLIRLVLGLLLLL